MTESDVYKVIERVDIDGGGYEETKAMEINGIGCLVIYTKCIGGKTSPSLTAQFINGVKVIKTNAAKSGFKLDRGF